MSNILVFDLGTTYFKVSLFDETGRLVELYRLPTPVECPVEGRVELPVTTFRTSLMDATRTLSRKVGGLNDVVAVSFASQTNSFALWDQYDEPLTPFLLWSDQRALGEEYPLQDFVKSPEFYAKTGVPSLNHEFLIAKLAWLQQYEPATIERTRRLTLISDYLTWWMTGSHVTEAGVAGLTGLVDIHQLTWWSDACSQTNLPLAWLPTIVRAGTDVGPILGSIADEFDLPHDCRFIVGCLDQYAGAIGAGNVMPGRVSETTGTVLATVRCSDYFQDDAPAEVFQGPTWKPGQYYQMVFSDISAGLLEKYRNALPDRPSFAELDQLAERVPQGAEGLRLHADALRRKGDELFTNRQTHHTRGHDVRAILEAVAGELQRQVVLLCGEVGPTDLISVGGAAKSDLWLKIKSHKLGGKVRATKCSEPTSLGAAMLAKSSLNGISLVGTSREWSQV